ncbi:Protein of unknown function [Pyronema omphalodes CBS 100304]|uniref:Uncharacterized protein n=1 Tax=Pyronema omphalodes (strain CBS 100304) TaxID=1076935 RepID=U4L8C6_PYROM|nr:Protein of unknown function [Pyronema omphalodes CBS 100304]
MLDAVKSSWLDKDNELFMKRGEEHGTRLNRRNTNRQVAAKSGGGRNHRWTKDASAFSGIGPSNQKFRKVSASVGGLAWRDNLLSPIASNSSPQRNKKWE